MLQAGHELGLGLEPTDEPRVVRVPAMDGLDRDLPADLRLEGPVDGPERSRANLLQEPVPAKRLAAGVQRGILAKDQLLETAELRRGVDPQLRGQDASGALEGLQRLGLASRPVQRGHEMGPQSFPERVGPHEDLQLRNELPVAPQIELGGDALFAGRQPELLQAGDLRLEGRLVGEIPHRGAPPEPQRPIEGSGRGCGIRGRTGPALGHQGFEPQEIDR